MKVLAACDALVAYLDTPDSYGSVAEIAWAAAKGLPCLVVLRGVRAGVKSHDEQMADAYWFVAQLPHVDAEVVENRDETVGVIARFLSAVKREAAA